MTLPSIEDNCCDTYLQLSLARILSKIPKRIIIMCVRSKTISFVQGYCSPHHPSKLFHFYQPSALGFKGSKRIFEPEYTLFWDEVCHLGTPGSGDIDICDHVKGFGSGNVSWCFLCYVLKTTFCLSTRDQTSKVTIQHNSSHQRNFITQRSDTHQQTSQVVIIQSGSYFQMFLNIIFSSQIDVLT